MADVKQTMLTIITYYVFALHLAFSFFRFSLRLLNKPCFLSFHTFLCYKRFFAFSSDGHTLASGKQSPNLIIWNLTSGKQRHNLPTGFNNYPTSVAFSPDGHTLVSGS